MIGWMSAYLIMIGLGHYIKKRANIWVAYRGKNHFAVLDKLRDNCCSIILFLLLEPIRIHVSDAYKHKINQIQKRINHNHFSHSV